MIGLLGLALAGLFITGCSTTHNLPIVTDEKPTPTQALIIVEGSDSWSGMFKLYAVPVYDNKTLVGKVAPHDKLVWLRDPGMMGVSVNNISGRRLFVSAGKTYKFKVECHSMNYTMDGPGDLFNAAIKE